MLPDGQRALKDMGGDGREVRGVTGKEAIQEFVLRI